MDMPLKKHARIKFMRNAHVCCVLAVKCILFPVCTPRNSIMRFFLIDEETKVQRVKWLHIVMQLVNDGDWDFPVCSIRYFCGFKGARNLSWSGWQRGILWEQNKLDIIVTPEMGPERYIGRILIIIYGSVFGSYCYYNKLPQTVWLETIQIYYLIGLEVRSLTHILQC